MPFSRLGLGPDLLRAFTALGYEKPFPVQEQAIPAILAGGDLVVQAQTGSGKTVAFLSPILQRLALSAGRLGKGGPRALVLVPTRELAMQIGERAVGLVKHLPVTVRVRTVFGGVSINPQMLELRGGAELLVATPGRLLDLVRQNAVQLRDVECLVLDEADKMLDEGFAGDIEAIKDLVAGRRQTLLFSATLSIAVRKLIHGFLKQPKTITVTPDAGGLELAIDEKVYLVSPERKGPLLRELIQRGNWPQVLVFVGSGHRADNVVRKLANNGIQAMAIHGDKSQGARTAALLSFRGSLGVLVATDVMARGIDLSGLACVINYELPRSARDYTHRIGRTGRAGQPGTAISLVCPEEEAHLRLIEKTIKRNLPRLPADDSVFGRMHESGDNQGGVPLPAETSYSTPRSANDQ